MRNDEVLNRLQNLINYMPLQKEISQKTGIKQNTLSSKSARNSNWAEEEIQKLNKAYNIDIFKGVSQNITPDNNSVSVDFYPDVFGSCGSGSFVLSETKEKINIPVNCFLKPFSQSAKYSVITARGNSMYPAIYDKDRLIVQHWNGEQIIDNQIYVFCYRDEIFVKRLSKNVNQLVITSDNKDFDTIKLLGEDLNNVFVIGQIVGLMRDLR